MTVQILTVCTGNICRSPVAAQLLDRAFPGVVTASSAGLGAVVGSDIDPVMRAVALESGVSLNHHVARAVAGQDLLAADLVLTMTIDQRGGVLDLSPRVLRRSFTLKEFTRLTSALVESEKFSWLSDEPTEVGLRRLVPLAARYRGVQGSGIDDNIADPFRRPGTAYRNAFNQIHDAVNQLTQSLSRVGNR